MGGEKARSVIPRLGDVIHLLTLVDRDEASWSGRFGLHDGFAISGRRLGSMVRVMAVGHLFQTPGNLDHVSGNEI